MHHMGHINWTVLREQGSLNKDVYEGSFMLCFAAEAE